MAWFNGTSKGNLSHCEMGFPFPCFMRNKQAKSISKAMVKLISSGLLQLVKYIFLEQNILDEIIPGLKTLLCHSSVSNCC